VALRWEDVDLDGVPQSVWTLAAVRVRCADLRLRRQPAANRLRLPGWPTASLHATENRRPTSSLRHCLSALSTKLTAADSNVGA